jgi:hypothetical protein
MTVTCRNMYGSPGMGQIQLYRRPGTGAATRWSRVWSFPDPAAPGEPHLSIPHHGRIFPLEGGGYELLYAHSDGLSATWGSGDLGTAGSARLETIESPPVYQADEALDIASSPVFGFVRSFDLLPGGERLIGDSGALDGSRASAAYVLEPADLPPGTRDGAWSATHDQQQLVEVHDAIERRYACGFGALYEADWIDPADFGAELRRMMALPAVSSCQAPPGL